MSFSPPPADRTRRPWALAAASGAGALLLVATVTGGASHDQAGDVVDRYYHPGEPYQVLLTDADNAALRQLARLIPRDVVTANVPANGSAFLYAFHDRPVLFESLLLDPDPDHALIGEHLRDAASRTDVCDALRREGVEYAITGPERYWLNLYQRTAGIAKLEEAPGFTAGRRRRPVQAVPDPGLRVRPRLAAARRVGRAWRRRGIRCWSCLLVCLRRRRWSSVCGGSGRRSSPRCRRSPTQTGAINLGQGFPDTDGPRRCWRPRWRRSRAGGTSTRRDRACPSCSTPWRSTSGGSTGCRSTLAREVLVTAGATEGIASVVLALCEPGDEVVTFEPYYDSYAATIALAGAVRRTSVLRFPSFEVDEASLRAAFSSRTRLVLLNSPHNPTGKVFSRAELELVCALAREFDAWVVTDEVYEHLTFDGVPHVPVATLPGMWERTISISSSGKTFSATGWKVGWVTGPAEAVAAARTVKQFLTYVASGPFQPAVALALGLDDSVYTGLAASLERKRDLLCEGLVERPVCRCRGPRVPTSSWPTPRRWGRPTGWRSVGSCRRCAAWSGYRCRCSTTTWRRRGRWSGSRSARRTRCCRRRRRGWRR